MFKKNFYWLREEVVIPYLQTGHRLLTHIYLMAKESALKSQQCKAVLTVRHVIEG